MKINTRTILKIARLYNLADDKTPVKSLRHVSSEDHDSYLKFSFTLDKRVYVGFYGTVVDEDDIDDLWENKPEDFLILKNPLDDTNNTTPFQGKYLVIFEQEVNKKRLDIYLSTVFDSTVSRSLWQKYISAGFVKVNGEIITSAKFDVTSTDEIEVSIPELAEIENNLPVIYEDEDVLVINKPAGILTHAKGGIANEATVADMIKSKTTYNTDSERSGIVHRLDRDTSGVLIVARHADAAKFLQDQFADRKAKKTYLAVVNGQPKLDKAEIDLPINRNPTRPSTFRVDPNGKSAQTTYFVLGTDGKKSLVELRPRTGRTHQLRVHMAHLGNPIIGDRVYGKASDRLMLHAYKLSLTLPSGKEKTFEASIPDEFTDFMQNIKLS